MTEVIPFYSVTEDHDWCSNGHSFQGGDGGDGSGENMLGRILMEVREEPRKERA